MTTKEFMEALSKVGNSPDFDSNNRTRSKSVRNKKAFIVLAAVSAALIVAAVLFYVLLVNNSDTFSTNGDRDVLQNNETESAPDATLLKPTEEQAVTWTPGPSSTSNTNSSVSMSYRPVTFEECLDYTSDVVMAKCRQSAEKNGYTEYYFDIETYYFSVHEYRETNIYVIAYPPYDEYKTGDSYFLLLERRPKVLEPRDVYLPVPVEVDINELRNSKVQRKSIEEKSDVTAKELDDFAEFLNYITDHIANGKHNYAKGDVGGALLRV